MRAVLVADHRVPEIREGNLQRAAKPSGQDLRAARSDEGESLQSGGSSGLEGQTEPLDPLVVWGRKRRIFMSFGAIDFGVR